MTDIIIIDDRDEPEDSIEVDEESEDPFFIEMRDVTKSSVFSPRSTASATDTSTVQDDFPITGGGRLDNLLVISNSDQFDINVAVDDRDVVDDSFSTLNSISNELENVSAYSRSNQHIVVVSSYPFNEAIHADIRPRGEINFPRVRAEGVIEDEER